MSASKDRQATGSRIPTLVELPRGVGLCAPLALLLLSAIFGALACRGDRQLELFTRKQPEALPCGDAPQCPPHAPVCSADVCAECATSADCKKDKPVCAGGKCVKCTSDADCPEPEACNTALARCAKRCTDSVGCSEKALPLCELERGYCVQCVTDAECGGAAQRCDALSGSCVDCSKPDPCPDCVLAVVCSADAG